MTAPVDVPVRPRQRSLGSARDFVPVLHIFAVVVFLIPARYGIAPLGAVGGPATLIGLGITLLWLVDWFAAPWPRSQRRQPLSRSALWLTAAVLISYLVAAIRPTGLDEQLAADRALLNIVGWLGLMMAARDGITSRAALDRLLRRVVVLAGLEAGFGVLQFVAGRTFVEYLHVPGLVDGGFFEALDQRGSLLRIPGTAVHPIEFAVTLAMLLPLALHYAVADAGRRSALVRWLPVAAIAVALPLAVSRSAVICAAVVLTVLLASWPRVLRRRVYLALPVLVAAMAFCLPGFLRTFLNLFTGISGDSSTVSRTDSYALAWTFISRAPVFGRGAGTFLPRYRILDNQYLGSLIEIGVVGVACLLLLFAAALRTAWQLREQPPGSSAGHGQVGVSGLGPALGAAIAGGCVSFAFFDAWSFPLISSMLALLMGSLGALWRLSTEGDQRAAAANSPQLFEVASRSAGGRGPLIFWTLAAAARRWWPVTLLGVLATGVGTYAAACAPGVYVQQVQVVMVAPAFQGHPNALQVGDSSLIAVAGLLCREVDPTGGGPLVMSPTVTISDLGIRSGVWARLANSGGQWATNFNRAEVDLQVAGDSAATVRRTTSRTLRRMQTILLGEQVAAGVPANQLITLTTSPASPPVRYQTGSSGRAAGLGLALGLGLVLAVVGLLDRFRGWRLPTA